MTCMYAILRVAFADVRRRLEDACYARELTSIAPGQVWRAMIRSALLVLLLLCLSPVAFAQTTLVHDTFTDADGTEIVAHVPEIDTVGLGWEAVTFKAGAAPVTNDLEIQGGRLVIRNANHAAVIDIGQSSDYTAQFDWVLGSGDNRISFIYRYVDGINNVIVNLREPEGDIQIESFFNDVGTNH